MPQLSGFVPDSIVQQLPDQAKVFVVGGAVRDELLGLPRSDRDWVVVGAQAADMERAGFLPVGADFPVFLHPETNEEYALARTERKSGHGYKGFTFYADPSVSLEDDLKRRDFTINSMAMSCDGHLIDPYQGQQDLQQRVFRHVSVAFEEDPLRVLRLARFLCRFDAFNVHPDTLAMCRQLVVQGEMGHLVPERVFVELNRAMGEAVPSRAWALLAELQAWESLCPLAPKSWAKPENSDLQVLDQRLAPPTRWAWWLAKAGGKPEIEAIAQALKIPNPLRDAAVVWSRLKTFSSEHVKNPPDTEAWLSLLGQVDLYRKPDRLADLLADFERLEPDAEALTGLDRLLASVQTGQFKDKQREYLQARPQEHPAHVVQSFKRDWVQTTLQKQQ